MGHCSRFLPACDRRGEKGEQQPSGGLAAARRRAKTRRLTMTRFSRKRTGKDTQSFLGRDCLLFWLGFVKIKNDCKERRRNALTIEYKTKGVCSQKMTVKLEDGVVQKVEILGGCAGNSQGVSRLVEGMRAEDAIAKLAGIRCGFKATSCPDQLSKALRIALAEEAKRQGA